MALFDINLGSGHHDHTELEPHTQYDSDALDEKFHKDAEKTPDPSATVEVEKER